MAAKRNNVKISSAYQSIIKHRKMYIKIRSEIIMHFHQVHNSHNYTCSPDLAIKKATLEYKSEKRKKAFFITLDELLLNSVDQCLTIIQNRRKAFIFEKLNSSIKI